MVRDVSSLLGCRQSMPSRSIASCAGVRNTLPSRAEGRGEAAAFQPFGQQAQSVAGGPQQFDLTAAAAPEDEDMAGHRVIFQHRLHLCGETIEAVAHVGDTGNQPDFGACWQVVITSFICPVMILMTSPDYFTTHMGLPDTGSGWISASTLNTVFRSSGFITASGAPCAITRPLASTTR